MNESRYHDDCQMLSRAQDSSPPEQINFSSQMSTVLNVRNPDLEIVVQNVYILFLPRELLLRGMDIYCNYNN